MEDPGGRVRNPRGEVRNPGGGVGDPRRCMAVSGEGLKSSEEPAEDIRMSGGGMGALDKGLETL